MRPTHPLLQAATDRWWFWLVRGILALILSLLAFVQPGATLGAFTLLLGAYFLIDGVLALVHGLGQPPAGRSRLSLLLWGVIGILAGLSIFAQPRYASVLTMTVVVGFWAVVTGAQAIITGLRRRDETDREWQLIGAGIASIVFGALVWSNLAGGATTIAFLIGTWAFIVGVLHIILGFWLKRLGARTAAPPAAG